MLEALQAMTIRTLLLIFLMFASTAWSQGSSFIWPTQGKVINTFDATTKGIDIAGKMGQPVVAASDGKVLYAKNMRGYGNLIIIEHSDGMVTAYAHLQTITVAEGQTVMQGQQIAAMGDSDTDTVKLKFQIRHMGKPVDPITLLPSSANNLQVAKNTDANQISTECELFLSKTVKSKTGFPEMPHPLVVGLRIKLSKTRLLEEVKIVSPSENLIFDRQIERGIRKTGQFPAECPEDFIYRHSLNEKSFKTDSAAIAKKDATSSKTAPQLSTELNRGSEEVKKSHEQGKVNQRLNLQVYVTEPDSDGSYTLSIQTNTDTASLKINGEEQGGKVDGRYTISRVALAGKDTKLDIIAKDIYGNSETKTITIRRPVVASKIVQGPSNAGQTRRQADQGNNPTKVSLPREKKPVEKNNAATSSPSTAKQNGDFR